MKYKGQLVYHIEMCCGSWAQFHDDRGLHGENNQYFSWDWTLNFVGDHKIDSIKIIDNEDNIVYEGPLTFKKRISSQKGYLYDDKGNVVNSFPTPLELSKEDWMNICNQGYKCELETEELVDALKKDSND